MNLEQLTKNKGHRAQLVPTACRLDEYGQELPSIDDDWVIEDVDVRSGEVRLSNVRTMHICRLGKDHIHHYTSNPDRSRSEIQFCFLTLHVQVFMRGNKLWVRPTLRPGEPLKPNVLPIQDKYVDINYPSLSGIQQKLEADGFVVSWCRNEKIATKIDLENWEYVIETDEQGCLARFRLNNEQTLIKKRAS